VTGARRRYRWLMWCSAAGLAVTLAASIYSEFCAVSYRENTFGVPNRFLLYQSNVHVVYRKGEDKVMLTGLELFDAGWSIGRVVPRGVYARTWLPSYSYANGSIGTFWIVSLPLWVPALVFGAGVWFGRRMGGWRGQEICQGCGYDLRGLAGSVCPECGRTTQSGQV